MKVVVAYLRYYSDNCLEGLYLIQGSIIPADFPTRHVPKGVSDVSPLSCMAYLQLSLCLVLFNVCVSSIGI
jgi:hypothetical protein